MATKIQVLASPPEKRSRKQERRKARERGGFRRKASGPASTQVLQSPPRSVAFLLLRFLLVFSSGEAGG
jgi:hypothetical protein